LHVTCRSRIRRVWTDWWVASIERPGASHPSCSYFKAHQIAEGLVYLHSKDIVHGDLRGVRPFLTCLLTEAQCVEFQANVLIDDDWHPQLADFGLSSFSDATQSQNTSYRGSVRWMAPELLSPDAFGLGHFRRTKESDIHSLACLYLEVPFQHIARSELWLSECDCRYIQENSHTQKFQPTLLLLCLWRTQKSGQNDLRMGGPSMTDSGES
jgi:serine/threonine protein kinase